MVQERKKIEYVEGIRGICCVLICLLHFLAAFLPQGYIGWGSGVSAESLKEVYLSAFPYSIFLNSTLPVSLLISLVGYTVACRYFRDNDIEFLKKQAKKRYLRLMLPVFATTIISYGVYAFSLNYNVLVGEQLENPWIIASSYPDSISFIGAIFSGLFRVFFVRDGDYCSVLWCYHIIFLGSFMVYGFLALLGSSKKRYMGYLLLIIGLWYTNNTLFLGIVGGMIAGDIIINSGKFAELKPCFAGIMFTVGVILGCIPSVFLPAGLDQATTTSLGIVLILLGTAKSRLIQNVLSHRLLVSVGKYSSSVILVHFWVLVSITCFAYYKVDMLFENSILSVGVAFVVFAVFTTIFVRLFYRWVEKPLLRLANRVG